MKTTFAVLLSTFGFLGFNHTLKTDKILLIVDQNPALRPIANSIADFWADREFFDTIQISGNGFVSELDNIITSFKKSDKHSDISYETCLIRFRQGVPVDTFYGWRWFDYWKRGDVLYFDKSEKLKKLFINTHHLRWLKNNN